MQIPVILRYAYDQILSEIPLRELTAAAQALSERYRQADGNGAFIRNQADRLAYLALRLPATYAAASRVFYDLRSHAAELQFNSMLDLGAGSGAATWAATSVFAALNHFELYEQDRELITLGKRLATLADTALSKNADWYSVDLRNTNSLPAADLVVASYAFNELTEAQAVRLALQAWQAAQKALVIIEPGTTKAFAKILAMRSALIETGAHLLAPCPHSQACPLPAGDWCHFAARVERTAQLRHLKSGALNYEDEKYAYLIFTKAPVVPAAARVLRHPRKEAGYVKLQLCTPKGLENATVTKRDKEAWRRVRKIEWGDGWE